MDRETTINELNDIIGDYLKAQGFDLVELIYRQEGNGPVLRILLDRPEGGISLGDCACLNREIGRILDEKDILQEKYILEASSPGLDRPLKTKSDFLRCLNRKARFYLCEPINARIELEGIISRVQDGLVYIDIEGSLIEIPLSKLIKAKQILE